MKNKGDGFFPLSADDCTDCVFFIIEDSDWEICTKCLIAVDAPLEAEPGNCPCKKVG